MADQPVSPYLLRPLRSYEEALADRQRLSAEREERQRRAAERKTRPSAKIVPLRSRSRRRRRPARVVDDRQLTLPLVAGGLR